MDSFYKEIPGKAGAGSFFVIISFNSMEVFFKIKELAEEAFSKVHLESGVLPKWLPEPSEKFVGGIGEVTRILSFRRRINREELPELKKKCIRIRNRFILNDRSIRIVPGYVTGHNAVIASLFDDFHRVYLFHGVYAEVVYKFERLELQAISTAPEFFFMKEVKYYFSNLREYHLRTEEI